MNIIIPMAGLSSRFTKAGFTLPKYMLYAKNKSLFNLAVSSFTHYFKTCRFIFIARDVFDTKRFIEEECKLLGIEFFDIVILTRPTKGQAETVKLGITEASLKDNESILIFNIDTFRPNYMFPKNLEMTDGYLEVFKGCGTNWSYARTEDGKDGSRVIETAEKKEISDNCSTGLYYFRTVSSFLNAFNQNENNPINGIKELYVAPLYNFLIKDGGDIRIHVIQRNDVIFCGTPDEYYDYIEDTIVRNEYQKSKSPQISSSHTT